MPIQISKLIDIIKECGDILFKYQRDIKVGIKKDGKKHKEYTWYIDAPNERGSYSRGENRFNILVRLIRDNTPKLGIIYHPTDRRLYTGGKNVTPKEIHKNV